MNNGARLNLIYKCLTIGSRYSLLLVKFLLWSLFLHYATLPNKCGLTRLIAFKAVPYAFATLSDRLSTAAANASVIICKLDIPLHSLM